MRIVQGKIHKRHYILEIIITTIELLNLKVFKSPACSASPGEAAQSTQLADQGSGADTRDEGRAPKMVPTHPTQSAEASEIKFHSWVHRDTNSSSMCLWLEEEIRFD